MTMSTQETSALATAQAPAVPPADPVQALMAIPGTVINLAVGFVAAVLSPFLAPGPVAPAEPPLLWAVLGWIRREVQRTFFNRAPIAVNDTFTTSEDITRTGNVLANDTDADDDPRTATLLTGPAHGDVVLNADGSFTYTPDTNFNGTDTFTYKVSDDTGRWHVHGLLGFFSPDAGHTDTATVTLSVIAVNDPPVVKNDSASTAEDTSLTVAGPGVLANDNDIEGNPLTATIVTGPSNGSATLNPNGSYTYTPNTNFNGTDTFTYRASDGTANSNTATVSITVTPANDAPVAVNNSYTTAEDTPLTVAIPGVLANDNDIDGNPLTATIVTGPSNGSATLNPNGSYTYTPNTNFNGTDTFTYRASDGTANSNTATVSITVTPANDAPVAVNNSYTTAEDTPLTVAIPGVLANDNDIDGNPLTATIVTGPSNGSATLNPNGSYTYTPNTNFTGTDTFTYRASDGTANSNTATVSITVTPANDAPLTAPDAYTTEENTALTITAPGLLTNDSHPDGDTFTADAITDPPDSGTIVALPDGSFTYTPNINFTGTDTFTYRVTDGVDQSFGVVTITVAPSAPVITTINTTTRLGEPGIVITPIATDAQGDTITYTVDRGQLIANTDGSYTYLPPTTGPLTDDIILTADDGNGHTRSTPISLPRSAIHTTDNQLVIVTDDDHFLSTGQGFGFISTSYYAFEDTATTTYDLTEHDLTSPRMVGYDNTHGVQIRHFFTEGGTPPTSLAPVITTINTTTRLGEPGIVITPIATDAQGDTITYTVDRGQLIANTDGSYTYLPPTTGPLTDDIILTADDGNGHTRSTPISLPRSAIHTTDNQLVIVTDDDHFLSTGQGFGFISTSYYAFEDTATTTYDLTEHDLTSPRMVGYDNTHGVQIRHFFTEGGTPPTSLAPVITTINTTTRLGEPGIVITPIATDAQGDTITYTVDRGQLIANTDGSYTYLPPTTGPLTDDIILTADDGNGHTRSTPISLPRSAIHTTDNQLVIVTDDDHFLSTGQGFGFISTSYYAFEDTATTTYDLTEHDLTSPRMVGYDNTHGVQIRHFFTEGGTPPTSLAPVITTINTTTRLGEPGIVITPIATDAQGDTITYTVDRGQLIANTDGSYTYLPPTTGPLTDDIILTADDGNGHTRSTPISLPRSAIHTTDNQLVIVTDDDHFLSTGQGFGFISTSYYAFEDTATTTYDLTEHDLTSPRMVGYDNTHGVQIRHFFTEGGTPPTSLAPVITTINTTTRLGEPGIVITPIATDAQGDTITYTVDRGQLIANTDGSYTYLPPTTGPLTDDIILTADDGNGHTRSTPISLPRSAIHTTDNQLVIVTDDDHFLSTGQGFGFISTSYYAFEDTATTTYDLTEHDLTSPRMVGYDNTHGVQIRHFFTEGGGLPIVVVTVLEA